MHHQRTTLQQLLQRSRQGTTLGDHSTDTAAHHRFPLRAEPEQDACIHRWESPEPLPMGSSDGLPSFQSLHRLAGIEMRYFPLAKGVPRSLMGGFQDLRTLRAVSRQQESTTKLYVLSDMFVLSDQRHYREIRFGDGVFEQIEGNKIKFHSRIADLKDMDWFFPLEADVLYILDVISEWKRNSIRLLLSSPTVSRAMSIGAESSLMISAARSDTISSIQSSLSSFSASWVPDSEADVCMVCSKTQFGVIVRRHHCRQCGYVICGYCSKFKALQEGNRMRRVRVCVLCAEPAPLTPK
ncbi:hypothetical protein HDU96_006409 [Phlyctochytrium bullatum]|nr:hypothetical protein HDU96_006409 [Phlyctochytrium bullatum]